MRFSEMLVRVKVCLDTRRCLDFTSQEIEKIRLRHSTLGMRFHLRDVIGHGNIEICETTTVKLKVYSQVAGKVLPDSLAHPSEVTVHKPLQELNRGLGLVGGGRGAVLAHHRLVGRHGEGSNATVLR
eukprot:7624-Hanusia_phi.AAC.1